jgi:molecular chaperone GrpE
MEEEPRVRVTDKRGQAREESPAPAPQTEAVDEEPDYKDLYLRAQAEIDNQRKRHIREKTELVERASARLVESLLPVLDNFERAIAHGDDDPGLAMVHREFRRTLEAEGLSEIQAEGVPFDPRVHEAVEQVEDPEVDGHICKSVYRKGYLLKGRVLRPAMVVVARPPESAEAEA